jgi:hypothetical protein
MIELATRHDFPAGLDRLWAVFGRPDYPRQKYLAMGATEVRVRSFRVTARAIDVELDRDVPVDPARWPPWARAFAPGRQQLHHATRWRRASATRITGELDISPAGLPVHAHGVGAIVEAPPGSACMRLDWQVRAQPPILGPSMERLFAAALGEALEADHAFTVGYLRSAMRAGTG